MHTRVLLISDELCSGVLKGVGVAPQPIASCVRKGVTNLRTINLLTYIIINIHCIGIYSVMYIYSDSHLLVLLHLQNQVKPTCVGPIVCGISRTSFSVPTQINTRAKLYSLVGIHKYRRPL